MLGAKSIYADECYKGNFIGADFLADIDLTGQLPDDWRQFNQKFIPIWLERNTGKKSKGVRWPFLRCPLDCCQGVKNGRHCSLSEWCWSLLRG